MNSYNRIDCLFSIKYGEEGRWSRTWRYTQSTSERWKWKEYKVIIEVVKDKAKDAIQKCSFYSKYS